MLFLGLGVYLDMPVGVCGCDLHTSAFQVIEHTRGSRAPRARFFTKQIEPALSCSKRIGSLNGTLLPTMRTGHCDAVWLPCCGNAGAARCRSIFATSPVSLEAPKSFHGALPPGQPSQSVCEAKQWCFAPQTRKSKCACCRNKLSR
jgi:hypothetical protein